MYVLGSDLHIARRSAPLASHHKALAVPQHPSLPQPHSSTPTLNARAYFWKLLGEELNDVRGDVSLHDDLILVRDARGGGESVPQGFADLLEVDTSRGYKTGQSDGR